jgi:flavin-dependent dehydrogenase
MANSSAYDIAVIGGGLSGLCLSIQAADNGYKVILFEKEQYPFHKVCGEYISLESWDFLTRLGVPLQDWQLPVIKKFQSSDVNGRLYNFDLPLGGFGISRFKLDNYLYNLALQKGVNVLTGTKVLDAKLVRDQFFLETVKADYKAAVVAGTFGKRSNLDIKWGRSFAEKKHGKLNNYIGIKYHVRLQHAADTITLHNFRNGYCGISKVEDDTSCLCYLTTAANLQQSGNSIAEMEKAVLQKNPLLRKIFREAIFLYDKPLAISQISFSAKNQVENNVLMLGDAAGMITPLCGNGMSMAMHASKLAFQSIDAFLQHKITRGQMEKEYIGAWHTQFAKRLWMGRMVQQLFGGNRSTTLFFKAMQAVPALAKQVIRSTHGEPF